MIRIAPADVRKFLADPLGAPGLALVFLPVFGLLFLGWGVDEVVLLYWIENLIIGLGVLARLLFLLFARREWAALFLAPFFAVHYFGFCAVHGLFLLEFFEGDLAKPPPFALVLLVWEAVVFALVFIGRGEWTDAEPQGLMFSPYGRIVVIHIGIFAAAAGAAFFDAPLAGALAVILLRAAWEIGYGAWRRHRRDAAAEAEIDGASRF